MTQIKEEITIRKNVVRIILNSSLEEFFKIMEEDELANNECNK